MSILEFRCERFFFGGYPLYLQIVFFCSFTKLSCFGSSIFRGKLLGYHLLSTASWPEEALMQSSGNIEANIRDCLDRQAGVNGLATGRDWAERHAEIAGIWPPLCQA